MNMRSKLVAVVGSGLLLATSITMAAAQSDQGDATVSITSNTNDNVITVSITNGDFLDHPYSLADRDDVPGEMTVTVDDMRGTAAGWTVNLKASDFAPNMTTSSPNADAFDIENLTLTPGAPTLADSSQTAATLDGQDANTLDPVLEDDQVLWTAANGNGAGEFDLVLDGDLDIPGGTLVGDYTSTVTVTLGAAPVPTLP